MSTRRAASLQVILHPVPKQLKVKFVVLVQPAHLLVLELAEKLQHDVIRVRPLAGVLPLRFDHVAELADRDQIVLVLLERFELGDHVVVEEAGRTEVRHRDPVHVDLEVRMPDLVQHVVDKLGERRILLGVPGLKRKEHVRFLVEKADEKNFLPVLWLPFGTFG